MFNGHTDTVTLQGYDGDPLSGHIANGRLYGRGSADMKSGMAAAMVATASAAKLNLRGDVILAAVADEECDSIGTEQMLAAGWRADAAIVAEPTGFAIITAHGSRPDLGVDAICKAGYFLVELDRYAQSLPQRSPTGVKIDAPNVHVGIIRGGAEINSYPAKCTISIERRTIAGETTESVENELRPILEKLESTVPDFKFELRTTSYRPPYSIASDHPFVNLVVEHAVKTTGMAPPIKSETYWTDMALLSEAGIPGVIWGPKGCGLHSKKESVEVESIRQLADSVIAIAASYCQS
jgi:acetylornithine deacetylase/succinyl-diaminopimelate desuccinylase-like protein